jgi:hypothetical protein
MKEKGRRKIIGTPSYVALVRKSKKIEPRFILAGFSSEIDSLLKVALVRAGGKILNDFKARPDAYVLATDDQSLPFKSPLFDPHCDRNPMVFVVKEGLAQREIENESKFFVEKAQFHVAIMDHQRRMRGNA